MNEHRDYFRIKNSGDVKAYYNNISLNVIDISATGISVRTKELLTTRGIVTVKILHTTTVLDYELTRSNFKDNTFVLSFINQEQIEKLFVILKTVCK